MNSVTKKEMRWTPRLVKQLRGKRTLADFGALIAPQEYRLALGSWSSAA
jgi:hypothetical protein